MDEYNFNRSNLRRHVCYYLNIYDKKSNDQIGWLGDISEAGIMIISKNRLILNESFYILIELPKNAPFNGQKISIEIQLIWAKKDTNPMYYNHGGIVTYYTNITKKVIRALIHYYGFLDNQKINLNYN